MINWKLFGAAANTHERLEINLRLWASHSLATPTTHNNNNRLQLLRADGDEV